MNGWQRKSIFTHTLKQKMVYKVACIGFGAANMLFIAYLASVAPELLSHTVILDPYFDGGALQRYWPTVRSNTTWQQFIDTLRRFKATASYADQIAALHPLDQPTPLHVLARHLREAVEPYVRNAHRIKSTLTEVSEGDAAVLRLTYKKPNGTEHTLQVEKVIFSPGSSPKSMGHSLPTIPLSAALDSRQVGCYVSAGERVVLFGLAHSGVLIMKNLVDAGCYVCAVYNTPQPFLFARDGEYDGIKQDAAHIADSVLAGEMPAVELIRWESAEEVQDALLRAKWTAYSIGFENITPLLVNGSRQAQKYDPATAQIARGIYGFGIAYPSFTEIDGRKFWDVSIPSFADHILKTNILSTVSSE